MTVNDKGSKLAALRGLEASLDAHRRSKPALRGDEDPRQSASSPRFGWSRRLLGTLLLKRSKLRRAGLIIGGVLGVVAIGFGLLWWRLLSGPIALDLATPWITAAIEQNFGSRHKVEIGGTVLERDEHGRTAVRIRDIVVREADGKIVASAPRAEVGLSHASLLSGQPRAESLNLVGAEISVRIGSDGQFTLLPGGDQAPAKRTGTSAANSAAAAAVLQPVSKSFLREAPKNFAALLAWIDSLRALGLDGYDLSEIGLKNGRVIVDDQRTGQRSIFENISLSLTRPQAGEVVFSIGSETQDKPWLLLAGVKALGEGRRAVSIEARKIALRDVLLALRVGDRQIDADVPVSATLRAEIEQDGTPHTAGGRVVVGPGHISDGTDEMGQVPVDRAEATIEWDATRRRVSIPFQVVSGGNRFTLIAQAEAPHEAGGVWPFALSGGTVVIAPYDAKSGEQLLLNRIAVRGKFDPERQRIDLDQGDVGGKGVSFAVSGNLDYSGAEPRVALGFAAQQMSVAAFKQIWPIMLSTRVRAWVLEHLDNGAIDSVDIAINAPLSTLQTGGPPVPDDGISIEVVTSGATIRPVDGLPPITDADLVTRINGRVATIALGRGTVDLGTGRKLTVTNGLFEVPDTQVNKPPARGRVRIDGPVPAAAELLASDRLKEFSGAPIDPTTSRGTVTAQVGVSLALDPDAPQGTTTYTITTDVTNFAIDRFVMSQKIEAQTLRITANNQGYQVKGDVKIAGTPASIEYRKMRDEADAQFKLQSTLDDAARARLGADFGGAVTGPITVRMAGKVAINTDQDSRFSVDADLTQTKIENLVPGWSKAPGRPIRAAFTYIGRPKSARLEDIVVEGSGASIKGSVEVDPKGEFISANLPVFALSDGDKASLKADRAPDGMLRVVMRGDVIDGRGIVKASMGGAPRDPKQRGIADIDMDVKIGAVAGFNGEALRALDLRVVRRAGVMRTFSLNGKLGVDATLMGDMRGRNSNGGGKPVIYIESSDAGALFRLTDTYPRMMGGQMWVAMDPPTLDHAPQDGVMNVREFSIRGEAALDRVVAGAPGAAPNGVEFSRMRVEFTRSPGKMMLRDGVVRGPVVGATIAGYIDYANNDVNMSGTFVPLYGLNNAFGQIPIVGLFLGGDKEGLLGITYQVAGPPGRSVLSVNPISAVAPGLLRKFFEFP
ncbi:MAG: hypothetical protein ACXWJ6_02730, partial [Xanthobacteraceae bacterium]